MTKEDEIFEEWIMTWLKDYPDGFRMTIIQDLAAAKAKSRVLKLLGEGRLCVDDNYLISISKKAETK